MKPCFLASLPATRPVSRSQYEREEPQLREALLDAQYDLFRAARFPVIVLVEGFDGAGKSETINLLNEWMDARHIRTRAFGPQSGEERSRPAMWRYWQALPPKGRMGVFGNAWYGDVLRGRAFGNLGRQAFKSRLERVARFERLLADEGVLLLKFWFHLSMPAQKKRLKTLEADPLTRWRIREEDWQRFRHHGRFLKTAEAAMRRTSTEAAPWLVVDGADEQFRNLAVGRTLLAAMRLRLDAPQRRRRGSVGAAAARDVLATLDLSARLDRRRYEEELDRLQARLNGLSRHRRLRKRSVVLVFEGQDAAGKGGAIRRVIRALDARWYEIVPVAAPSEEERAQPYLWRFWRHVPAHGRFAIFDRSWYGRVLVERVEGFAAPADWKRAYDEINDFERQLARAGAIVVKFWLAISRDEQFRRFLERQETGFKRFKITPEDWRNRAKWQAYAGAVNEMVDRTSTGHAPWVLVEAEDKLYARTKILRALCERLEQEFGEGAQHRPVPAG
ncbi:MAG TPA: polyphosphate:AMP phosphotransferase [Burkholderiales bacterium]|nr:polyphosphate:AMP phosphotransferase [Burkholderiales bacterium]